MDTRARSVARENLIEQPVRDSPVLGGEPLAKANALARETGVIALRLWNEWPGTSHASWELLSVPVKASHHSHSVQEACHARCAAARLFSAE